MATKAEIGFGTVAVMCFAGAADAWLGTGVLNAFVDLLVGEPDPFSAPAQPMYMPAAGQGTHATLFLSAGLAAIGLGLTWGEVPRFLHRASLARPKVNARRQLIAALVFVARCCKSARPQDVAQAYYATTGEELERGELAKAIRYFQSGRPASIEKILGKIDDDEKRIILDAVCLIWCRHGVDSERATRAVERVAAAMGLEGNDINTVLDASWTNEASKILKNVETMARKTVSRATTEAQRITTRLRGIG